MDKISVLVMFGGRSVEHDVSILTGLQAIEAMDPTRFKPIPLYVDADGTWWSDPVLLDRNSYPLKPSQHKNLRPVRLDLTSGMSGGTAGGASGNGPQLLRHVPGLLGGKDEAIPFDIILPAIHGSNGEDGSLQGMLDFANIPYTGCSTLAAATTMDKVATKARARALGLRVLDEVIIERPADGAFLEGEAVEAIIRDAFGGLTFPLIAKPVTLGSSVGVARVTDMDALIGALLAIFKMDSRAMIEPCVDPLVEYNVAVSRALDGGIRTSAIERPKTEKELLDFATKYLGSGSKKAGAKGGAKAGGQDVAGMALLSRTLAPSELTDAQETLIRDHASALFDALGLSGSVRIDFLANGKTGEIWLNEANTVPGSFAFFLWEAADPRLSFIDLVSHMIDEGLARQRRSARLTDIETGGAKIFGLKKG